MHERFVSRHPKGPRAKLPSLRAALPQSNHDLLRHIRRVLTRWHHGAHKGVQRHFMLCVKTKEFSIGEWRFRSGHTGVTHYVAGPGFICRKKFRADLWRQTRILRILLQFIL